MLHRRYLLALATALFATTWHTASPSDLPWTGPRTNATATVGTKVFSYKILAALDATTMDGRLSMNDTTNGVKWAYNDHQHIQMGTGQWHWQVGDDHKWTYDITSDTWSYIGGKYAWERSGLRSWLNRTTEDVWDFIAPSGVDGFTDTWEHRIGTFITHRWGMDPVTDVWKDIDRNIFWTFDQANMRWVQTGDASGNIWSYDPKLETWSYAGPDATDNRWRSLNGIVWVEEYSGTEWRFLGGAGAGQWRKNDGPDVRWNYNVGTHRFVEDGTGNTKHFPPHLPSPVVHQMNSIWVASNGSLNGAAFDEPNTNGPNVWTDGTNTLTVDNSPASAGFKMELGGLGVNVGRGSSYGFSTWGGWESTDGERWDGYNSHDTGYSYRNNSTSIATANRDVVLRNDTTNTWWREDFEGHSWLYYAATNKWHNKAMDEWFTYDFETLTWTLDGSAQTWHYINNGGGDWVWQSDAGEKWRYVDGTPNRWIEVSTGHSWSASGNHLFNISTVQTWHYDKTSKLWYQDGDTETSGKQLFPQVMPNLVGYAGALCYLALTETVSTSPRHTVTGFVGRMNARRAEYEALQAEFDDAMTNDVGLARYNKMLPLQTKAQRFAHGNMLLQYDFSGIYNMYTKTSSGYMPSDETFSVWNPTYWRFIEPGKGAVLYSYTGWSSLKIGLSAEPSTDGSSDFTIVIDPTISSEKEGPEEWRPLRYMYDSCNVRVYQGETLLTDEALSVMPTKTEEGTGYINAGSQSIWLSFNNGKITMGREDPTTKFLTPNAFDVFFEYEITDTATAATMQYHSVSHLTEKPLEFGGVSVRPQQFAYFDTQSRSVDLWNQTADQVVFSRLSEEMVRAKADILAMATVDTTHRERLERLQTKQMGTTLAALATVFGGYRDNGFSDSGDGYLSAATKPYLDSLFDTCTYGAAICGINPIDGLQLYFGTSVPTLEKGIEDILDVDVKMFLDDDGNVILGSPPELDPSPVAVIMVTPHSMRNELFDHAENLTTQLSGALLNTVNDLVQTPGNEDLSPFTNFLQEEISLVQSVNNIMDTMKTILFRRLFAQAKIYQEDPDAIQNATANLLAAEAQDNKEKELIIDSLSAQLSSGTRTLFSVIAAPAMVLSFGSTFDEVRRRVHKFLIDQGETNFNTIPPEGDPLRDYDTARAKIVTLLDAVESLLKQEGNQFYKAFAGDLFDTIDPPDELIVEEEVTAADSATIADQEKIVPPGTSTKYRKNINVKTADTDPTESVVREVKVDATDKTTAPARVFVKDALLSLGNGNFSKDAGRSVSVLGAAQVTPDGNARIELNDNIYIFGDDALAPTKNFGDDASTATRCIGELPIAQKGQHEIEFYSDVERTITVGRDVDFNLTGFGKGRTSGGQRITFGGKIKLIMEPGSRLRLPYIHPDKRDYALIVGFKDNAELVFQGTENRDETRWADALNGSDKVRSKILGTGTLEFSGEAKMKVMRTALVGVEADYTSNITDITLSVKDSAQVLIGDDSIAGGAFQVGNVVEGGRNHLKPGNYPNTNAHSLFGDTDNPFEPRKTHIDFTLSLDGRNALFHLGREAFCGFGVGTVNKKGNPNGTTPDAETDPADDPNQFDAWRVQSLHNTGNITIDITNGVFSHHQVALGNDREAAVLAFGPQVSRANYKLKVTKRRGDAIKGGGTVIMLRSGVTEDNPLPLRIWDSVNSLVGGTDDNGKSSIMAPATVLARRLETNTAGEKVYKRAAVKSDSSSYQITGPLDEVFLAVSLQDLEVDGREAVATSSQSENKVTFVKNKKITTQMVLDDDVKDSRGKAIATEKVAEKGYVKARDAEDIPQVWTKPSK